MISFSLSPFFSISSHANDQKEYTEEKEVKRYPESFTDKCVHRTRRDNDGVIKHYLRFEQCSYPKCIILKFDECICVDDVAASLPVTTKHCRRSTIKCNKKIHEHCIQH